MSGELLFIIPVAIIVFLMIVRAFNPDRGPVPLKDWRTDKGNPPKPSPIQTERKPYAPMFPPSYYPKLDVTNSTERRLHSTCMDGVCYVCNCCHTPRHCEHG